MRTQGNIRDMNAGATQTGAEDAQLDMDTAFMLLKNERRRRVLSILTDEPETTLSDLAERIAAIENGTDRSSLSSSQRKRVYVSLYQCHLPKLDDHDVIEFDSSRGDVVRQPIADQLDAYLSDSTEPDREPSVVTPAVGATLGVLTVAGVTMSPFVSSVIWGVGGGLGLIAVSVAVLLQGRSIDLRE